MLDIKEIESYKSYGRVLSITNGIVKAYVTLDLGPRIIYYGFTDGQNIMQSCREDFGNLTDKAFTDFFGKDKAWENFGGHRIWTSPEAYPETYYPDCEKVAYEVTENGAIFTPKAEIENGIAKSLEIKLDGDDTNMQVIMRVKNISDEDKKFAIWGLTVSEKGGTVIVPMNTKDTGLLSNRIISVWPYTDMSDKRIYWGKKYVTLLQDTKAKNPIKLGFDLNCGTVYYVLNDDVFCKRFDTNHPKGLYPDNGCSFETYTCDIFTEVESLGELKTVKSGETSTHIESWSLCKKPNEVDLKNDASIEAMLNNL